MEDCIVELKNIINLKDQEVQLLIELVEEQEKEIIELKTHFLRESTFASIFWEQFLRYSKNFKKMT